MVTEPAGPFAAPAAANVPADPVTLVGAVAETVGDVERTKLDPPPPPAPENDEPTVEAPPPPPV